MRIQHSLLLLPKQLGPTHTPGPGMIAVPVKGVLRMSGSGGPGEPGTERSCVLYKVVVRVFPPAPGQKKKKKNVPSQHPTHPECARTPLVLEASMNSSHSHCDHYRVAPHTEGRLRDAMMTRVGMLY